MQDRYSTIYLLVQNIRLSNPTITENDTSDPAPLNDSWHKKPTNL
jgi:hypothetical protein